MENDPFFKGGKSNGGSNGAAFKRKREGAGSDSGRGRGRGRGAGFGGRGGRGSSDRGGRGGRGGSDRGGRGGSDRGGRGGSRGRGERSDKGKGSSSTYKPVAKREDEDEEGFDEGSDKAESEVESESEEEETPAEKRLRLAKQYIAHIEQEEEDANETGITDSVSTRLTNDMLEEKGILQRKVALEYRDADKSSCTTTRGHKKTVTCLALTQDGSTLFTASKEGEIIKWDTAHGTKLHTFFRAKSTDTEKHTHAHKNTQTGHTKQVLALCVSSDGTLLASGGRDKVIILWDALKNTLLKVLTGHRGAVSGLAFRRSTHELFSCSHDRAIKLWNGDERTYIETLFGHQDEVSCIDVLDKDAPVSSGSRDASIRLWKISTESQLVFAGATDALECVVKITEHVFFAGDVSGNLTLWDTQRKRPIATLREAHGKGRGIVSLGAFRHSDLVASGSWDGAVRLWKCADRYKGLTLVAAIPVVGFINGLSFSSDGNTLAVAVGQEHRCGRWHVIKEARNGARVFTLKRTEKEKRGRERGEEEDEVFEVRVDESEDSDD